MGIKKAAHVIANSLVGSAPTHSTVLLHHGHPEFDSNLVPVIVPSKKLKRQNGKNVILKKEQVDFYHYRVVVYIHTLLTQI